MSLRLTLAELYVPGPLRRRGLDELAHAAAAGFGCAPPRWHSRRYADRLEEFALFTARQAARVHETGRDVAVTGDLRRQARQLGRRLRWHVGARSQEEALRAATILYRQIGIELSARNGGLVEMTSCFFSRAYDPQVCRIMSAMDEGLFSGLTDGSTLSFERRITEGATSCVASLRAAEACTRSS